MITLRNTSIPCTDLFLFEKHKGYIEVRIKNDNDNNRDTNLNQRITWMLNPASYILQYMAFNLITA